MNHPQRRKVMGHPVIGGTNIGWPEHFLNI